MAEKRKKRIIGFTKPGKFLFFKIKPKPIYGYSEAPSAETEAKPVEAETSEEQGATTQTTTTQPTLDIKTTAMKQGLGFSFFDTYVGKVVQKNPNLDVALRARNITIGPVAFTKKMVVRAAAVAVVATLAMAVATLKTDPKLVILAPLLGFAIYMSMFNNFLTFPQRQSRVSGKEVEKDVLFATRDMIVGMRSGLPLFNAMVSVSTGYGAASAEFSKIIEYIQLGIPIEQAIDTISGQSGSPTFRRIMLQASVSIRAGADIIGSLQQVIDEVSQERVIELRRYGQKLNAISMFYMLFGVIFPSMGIAIAAILTTFISVFAITPTTLLVALIGIIFLQIVFLNLIMSARPVFAT